MNALTMKALLLALPLAAALTACPSATTGGNGGGGNGGGNNGGLSISGTLNLTGSGSLGDMYVLACPASGDCGSADAKVAQTSSSGKTASFTVSGLSNQKYQVFAWGDKNGNQDIDAGDLLGMYTDDGQNPKLVTPPASGLAIAVEQQ
ncbi:MAG TPA: hypothetical protein VHN99_10855 [Deinococcales bacterium]|nr:hypothetical protein [Deinococcales bacterium]